MHFQQSCQEITTASIPESRHITVNVLADMDDNALVIAEQGLDEARTIVFLPDIFAQVGQLEVLLHSGRRIVTNGTDTLRKLVDYLIELVILSLEKEVLAMKIRPLDVPMGPRVFNDSKNSSARILLSDVATAARCSGLIPIFVSMSGFVKIVMRRY